MEENNELSSLEIEGTAYKTLYTTKFENRKAWVKPNEKHVVSFIPGTIVEIFVKEKQTVVQGEVLFILEAMKMKNKIISPLNGVVKSIYVSKGRIVPKGFLMLEFL